MPHTTMRRFSDTVRRSRNSSAVRRWLAIGLVVLCCVAGYLILGRDVDWQGRLLEAKALGRTAENNGNYPEARRYYESALANNPYDWETHLALANILDRFLDDNAGALRHYAYALAYSPEPSIVEETRKNIAILKLVRSGVLENPRKALEDMFLAAEAGAEEVFNRRLTPQLRDDFMEYWRGWSRRGRGVITYCRITGNRDGFYDAMVEMNFPDGTSMSLHLLCPVGDIWRLELAFP